MANNKIVIDTDHSRESLKNSFSNEKCPTGNDYLRIFNSGINFFDDEVEPPIGDNPLTIKKKGTNKLSLMIYGNVSIDGLLIAGNSMVIFPNTVNNRVVVINKNNNIFKEYNKETYISREVNIFNIKNFPIQNEIKRKFRIKVNINANFSHDLIAQIKFVLFNFNNPGDIADESFIFNIKIEATQKYAHGNSEAFTDWQEINSNLASCYCRITFSVPNVDTNNYSEIEDGIEGTIEYMELQCAGFL